MKTKKKFSPQDHNQIVFMLVNQSISTRNKINRVGTQTRGVNRAAYAAVRGLVRPCRAGTA